MVKVLRKIKLNTNFKHLRVVMFVMLLVMVSAVAYAKKVEASQKTERVKVASNAYVQAEYVASIDRTLLKTTLAKATGEATWTNISGQEIDYAYVDTGMPYAVVQFTFKDNSWETHSMDTEAPFWQRIPSGVLTKCIKTDMPVAYVWDSATKTRLTSTYRITAEY